MFSNLYNFFLFLTLSLLNSIYMFCPIPRQWHPLEVTNWAFKHDRQSIASAEMKPVILNWKSEAKYWQISGCSAGNTLGRKVGSGCRSEAAKQYVFPSYEIWNVDE